MSKVNAQAFPTMITPYNAEGKVDYEAVEKMVEWYWNKGCGGIFAGSIRLAKDDVVPFGETK